MAATGNNQGQHGQGNDENKQQGWSQSDDEKQDKLELMPKSYSWMFKCENCQDTNFILVCNDCNCCWWCSVKCHAATIKNHKKNQCGDRQKRYKRHIV